MMLFGQSGDLTIRSNFFVVLLLCLSVLACSSNRHSDKLPSLDFKSIITKAKQEGKTYISIPAGSYSVNNKTYLHRVKDLIIDGTDVKLFVTKIGPLFFFDGCENLTIKGFTIDYDPLPFTQGTIKSITNKREVLFDIHDGYPDITEENIYESLYVFDKETLLWKAGLGDIYGEMQVINTRTGYIKTKIEQPKLEVGDLVAIPKRRGSTFHSFGGSNHITFEDLTIYSSPSMVFSGRFAGPKHRFNRITITRGGLPNGATVPRLLSSNADAINYGISNSSPIVENSEFAFIGDDVINFHGPHFPIIKVENSTSFLTVRIQKFRKFEDVMPTGSKLRHLADSTYKIIGTTEFESIVEVSNHGLDKAFLKKQLPLYTNKFCNIEKCTVYRINTQSALNMEVGQSFDFPDANNSNFIVRNSYIHDNRGKVRIMSSDGIIEGNRFERQRGTAVNIGTEYPHWGEAGWSENIIIRNNSFNHIGIGNVFTTINRAPAAISIYTMNNKGNKYTAGHSNILIENNIIENSYPAAIYAYGVKDILIKNNVVKNSFSVLSKFAGSARDIAPRSAIDIHPDSIGILQNNTIITE